MNYNEFMKLSDESVMGFLDRCYSPSSYIFADICLSGNKGDYTVSQSIVRLITNLKSAGTSLPTVHTNGIFSRTVRRDDLQRYMDTYIENKKEYDTKYNAIMGKLHKAIAKHEAKTTKKKVGK